MHSNRETNKEKKVVMILVDKLYTPIKGTPRRLRQSIREHGILKPLIVVDFGNEYMVNDGKHRLAAAKKVGLKEVPCIVIRCKRKWRGNR